MKRFFFPVLICFFSSSILYADNSSRKPVFAGSFYPSNPGELKLQINGFLGQVPAAPKASPVKILLVPHAGYVYSGQVAAYGYKLVEGESFDTVILIGPSHRIPFSGASIWKSGSWESPLGKVEIDSELALKIFSENSRLQNGPEPHLEEHSLEVQIPFLQTVLKPFKIVPILMGDTSPESASILARAILKNSADKNILIIISTDMSHYHDALTAESMDEKAISLIRKEDDVLLFKALQSGEVELCGAPAVLTFLHLLKKIPGAKLDFLKYSHSGKVTNDSKRVVGYLSMAVEVSESRFSAEQKKELIRLARQTLREHVLHLQASVFKSSDPKFLEHQASFVTLKKNGRLRGCVGNLIPIGALTESVQNNTIQAAMHDPRFQPVESSELNQLEIEISVLSLPAKVQGVDAVRLGVDGVIIKNGNHSGVFLPQVATETGWDKVTFMNELCTQKAGLKENCWQDPATEILTFTSESFSEPYQNE